MVITFQNRIQSCSKQILILPTLLQEDQLEDHQHEDGGHSHGCSATSVADPHYHSYFENYFRDLMRLVSDDGNQNNRYVKEDFSNRTVYTENETVKVRTNCDVNSASSNIGGVKSGAKSGGETRPRNMNVIFIIRIY